VQLRFAKWKELLALPKPAEQAIVLTALYHFSRGVAQAALGSIAEAEQERAAYLAATAKVPAGTLYNLNPAATILAVADGVLSARIAGAKGQTEEMLTEWKRAIAAEDTLAYNEPPDWFYPTRESLGGALLKLKRYEAADLMFREDLERNPGSGRSLWGRWQALRAQDGDVPNTLVVRRRWQDSWNDADIVLRVDDF